MQKLIEALKAHGPEVLADIAAVAGTVQALSPEGSTLYRIASGIVACIGAIASAHIRFSKAQ